MAKDKEMVTKIILKGITDPSLSKAFKNANNLANNHLGTLKKVGETAKKIAKAGVAAVAAGVTASAKAAIDYESAFAGVMKTVDETATTSYDDLSTAIRNMAKEMPASAVEIANVASAAGQLGIKADDIEGFTKTMINLGETTNLSSDEAATAIAKYANITNMSMADVDKFGATLVDLGNNAATTEADIMNMASRIASSGSMIGLSNQEILALATSLSSVGLEAEGGGTAISTVLSQIDREVATSGEQLATWASLAGMSASEFKTAWTTDTMGTIQKVVNGMGDAKAGGTNLNVILEDLGITGIRTSDTMKRMTNAAGLLSDMTGLANSAWEENSALTNEANVRYNTMAARIQIFKNKLVDVAITIGNKLMPVMDAIMNKLDSINWDAVGDKIVGVINWISDHSTMLITIIGAVAAAFVAFKVTTFIQGIITVITVITTLCKKFGVLNTIIALNPIPLIVAAIAALVVAFVILWKKCDGFRNFWINLWNGLKSIISTNLKFVTNWFTVTIPNAFNAFVDKCKSVGTTIKNFFTVTIPNAFNAMGQWFAQLPSRIGGWLAGVGQKISAWGASVWAKAKQIGANFVNGIVNFFKQLPYRIGYCIGFVIGKIALFGQKLWNFATVTVPQFIGKVVNWFAQLPSRIWTWLTNTIQKIGAWGARMIALGKAKAIAFVNAVVNFFKTLPSKVWTCFTNTLSKITAWGSRMLSIGKQKALAFLNAVISTIQKLPSRIWSWLSQAAQKVVNWGVQLVRKGKKAATDLFNAIVNKIKEIPSKLLSLGKDIVEGLWNGIKNAKDWLVDKIKDFAGGITDGIKDALGINSPSVVMMKLAKFVPQGFGLGIEKNTKYAVRAVNSMGGKVTAAASRINPAISTRIPAHGTGGTFTNPHTAIVGDKPETIVPHGNTARNRGLLSEAINGVFGNQSAGGSGVNITFAPVIHGGSASENKSMLEEEFERFKQMMDEYLTEKGALAY